MIYTARQLEDLHKANGHVSLPAGARLSPLARDWLRARKVEIRYGESTITDSQMPQLADASTYLWWCDGPCAGAKAAVTQQARESNLTEIATGSDPSQLANAVRQIAADVKSGRGTGAVILVQTGATAMVLANRCPSLRAVLGTCLDSVDQAVRHVAANVLVIEHKHKTFMEVRTMLRRFVTATRELAPAMHKQLEELSTCG